jgi:hypothetical protein
MALLGLSAVLLCFACGNTEPTIRVAIDMPVSDFNRQSAVQEVGGQLDEDRSDVWGTGEPLELVMQFPHGNVEFEPGNSISGTILSSAMTSPEYEDYDHGKISSISVTATRSALSFADALSFAKAKCLEVATAMGQQAPRFDNGLGDRGASLKVAEGALVCRVVDKTIDANIVIDRVTTSELLPPTTKQFVVEVSVFRTTDPKYR